MRCPRCGNENPGANRFCGMCGATLLPAPAVSTAQQAAAQEPTAVSPLPVRPAPAPSAPSQRPAEPRPAAPEREPVISGPSFLGLNQPASSPAASSSRSAEPRRASLSIDPHNAPSSRSVDYLLEDDEPRSGGAGKFILIIVALLLAVGLGYMRWKNQGLGWLGKSASKPPAATDSADSSDTSSSASPAGTNTSPSASTAPTPASPSPAASAAAPSNQPPADHPGSADSGSSSAPASAAPASTAPAPTPPAGNTANRANASPAPSGSGSAAAPTTDSAKDDPNVDSSDAAPAPAPKPKPSAAKPVVKSDPVTEAQKYLYGKGVRQDCDRGMRLLKPEADRSNSKAMTEMGALYSAGLCTPHDLPTAYRWFALALRKDPDNQALQGDLQKLWGEMTQPERQQAIRLSQ